MGMYWISDIPREEILVSNRNIFRIEFQTETRIYGVGSLRSNNFLIGPIIENDTETWGSLRSYEIRIITNRDAKYDYSLVTKNGYVHNGGIAGELSALISVFFHSRIYITSTSSGNLTEQGIRSREILHITRGRLPHWFLDHIKLLKDQNFTKLTPYLESLEKLDEKRHQQYANACTNYALALGQVGISDEMVYVRLVSAIESLSYNLRLSSSDTKLTKKIFEEASVNVKDSILKEELREIFQTRKATTKFKKFVKKYAPDYIRQRGEMEYGKINVEDLDEILDRIYKARSQYLHTGAPMFISEQFEDKKIDMDSSLGMSLGMRKFEETEKLPTIDFFEGLTRHCILSYLAENIK